MPTNHGTAADAIDPQNSGASAHPAFVESQRFRQWWLIALILGIAGLMWYCFVVQILLGTPVGTRPAPDGVVWLLTVLFGVGFPVLFLLITMRTEVGDGWLTIRFRPFMRRRIRLADITAAAAVTYHPIMDYGGWGVRWSFAGWCYSVAGSRGVRITLADGRVVMIGSQRAEELAEAITRG